MADRLDHPAIQAAQADGPSAVLLELLNEGLIDLAGQNHFRQPPWSPLSVYRRPPTNSGIPSRFFQHGADFRAAAVDEHHPDAHGGQQDDILHHGGFQALR